MPNPFHCGSGEGGLFQFVSCRDRQKLKGWGCVKEAEGGAGDQTLEPFQSIGRQDLLICWPQGIRMKECPCPHPMVRGWFQQIRPEAQMWIRKVRRNPGGNQEEVFQRQQNGSGLRRQVKGADRRNWAGHSGHSCR